MCVHIHAHFTHWKKKPNIKIWNTCTTWCQFQLYQFVGPHWSRQWLGVVRHLYQFVGRYWYRQWLGVVRQQATSWARGDPYCCYVASLGRIGLIPFEWFDISVNIWNHRCNPVIFLLTDTHIHVCTKIVNNMIWNIWCTTGHRIICMR